MAETETGAHVLVAGGEPTLARIVLNLVQNACEGDGHARGANVSVEGSLGIGYAHGHEWSSDLIFAGSVAGIPEERFAEEAYSVGLYAYETLVTDEETGEEQNFIVVSYFVE